MAVVGLYNLCAVVIDSVVIAQITGQSISSSLAALLTGDSGGIYERNGGIGREDIRIRFSTEAVKVALNKIGLTGYHVTTGHVCDLYFQKYEAGGTRVSAGFVKFTVSEGIAVWRSLSARDGALASAEFEIVGVSADGSASPFSKLTGQTTPTIPTTPDMFTLGGALDLVSFDIDTGINLQVAGSDGDPYPTVVAIDGIAPRASAIGPAIDTLGNAATEIAALVLTDVLAGGLRGTSPITFTFNQKFTHGEDIGGSPAMTRRTIFPTFDGTNAPIVMTGLT